VCRADRSWKEDRALARRLRNSRLKSNAAVEDIDYQTPRGLDRGLIRGLAAESAWVKQHLNIFLIGATGVGKSWLAAALAHKACRDGFTVYYARAGQLFRELTLAHADGSFSRLLRRLAQTDLLVIDDWAMAPLNDTERRDFLEICDDRYQTRSTILTSQVPVANWHAQIDISFSCSNLMNWRRANASSSFRKKVTESPSQSLRAYRSRLRRVPLSSECS
jgi:DNA replication protein DnaC